VIKDTTDTQKSSSYLTLYLDIDNGERLKTKLDKRDDFTFPLVNFPFISSNILADKRVEFRTKQNKTKQKQNKTKQNKTKAEQNKTKQNKTKQKQNTKKMSNTDSTKTPG
jgi:mannitol-specific phosphotransferase system IIBC component